MAEIVQYKSFSSNNFSRFISLRVISTTIFSLIILFTSVISYSEMATPSKLAVHSLLLDATQKGELMVVVGERGHILYSEDQGHNWLQAQVSSRVLLTGIHLHDNKLGWAVGHDATILRTKDGAKTWQVVYSDVKEQAPLLDVWFKDGQNGFAVGAYGLFLFTKDGGETWQRRWISDVDDFHLNHITSANDGTLFIAAEAGVVYRSENGGETWLSLPSPYHGSFFGSLITENQSLFLFGLRGHLFSSGDNGNGWTKIETGTTAMLTTAIKSKSGHCYIGGLGGVLLIDSSCDGLNMEQRQLPSRSGISSILEGDDGLILVGESGVKRYKP